MEEGRFLALAAGLAVLFWLLSGQWVNEPGLRRMASFAAYASLAVGLLWALLQSARWFLG